MKFLIGVVILSAFGCSETSTPPPAVCGPVGPDGQLDTQAAATLVVAPDERHVAYLRDPHIIEAGCVGRGASVEVGTLVAVELQSDGSACQRAIGHDVSPYSIYYSSDSQHLVWKEGIDDCEVGTLKAAASDGSNVRLVHGGVRTDYVIGSTVFFNVQGQNRDWAAPLAGGKAISLGPQVDFEDIRSDSNAAGATVAHRKYGSDQSFPEGLVLFQLPSGKSQTLVDGVTEAVGNRIWSPGGNWLAFCHGPKDAGAPASLTVIAADGSTRMDVSSNPDCWEFTFSPDDAWLAYGDLDASGGTRLLTYSLKDRSSVELGMLARGYFSLAFSDDGGSVVASVDATTWASATIAYAATTGVPGSLHFLTESKVTPDGMVSAGGYVAIATASFAVDPTGDRTIEVYPVSGGDPVTLQGSTPLFEPGVAQPHLLLRQYPPTAIAIAATDGTAVTPNVVPDYISFATWMGSTVVYGTSPGSGLVTIAALTNAGAVTTPLASEVESYAWAEIATPTRLFYSRKVASTGGPVGVFYVDVPR
jgi:hypothetical protein